MSQALLVLTLLLGTVSNAPQGGPAMDEPRDRVASVDWVRTAQGWQRPDAWHQPPPWSPGLHPFVVAAGQLLGSVWALVAFNSEGENRAFQAAS